MFAIRNRGLIALEMAASVAHGSSGPYGSSGPDVNYTAQE